MLIYIFFVLVISGECYVNTDNDPNHWHCKTLVRTVNRCVFHTYNNKDCFKWNTENCTDSRHVRGRRIRCPTEHCTVSFYTKSKQKKIIGKTREKATKKTRAFQTAHFPKNNFVVLKPA